MPCTRSMRSKPSGSATRTQPDEDETPVASPVASLPKTRTRTTKGKKVSKAGSIPDVVDVIKSPTESTRPKRSRVRSKVSAPVYCESPLEPKQRATRSTRTNTRQKATAKIQSAAVAAESDDHDQSDEEAEEEEIAVKPSKKVPASGSKPKASTTKKTTKTTKSSSKRKIQTTEPEPSSDPEASTADEGVPHTSKQIRTLTYEELYKCHIVPFKTALSMSVCDVVPKFFKKMRDPEAKRKQEEAFQALLNAPEVEMPPPPPPGKTRKARVKRARSPESTPSKTSVPASFNFDKSGTPAKKRVNIDADQTPNKQAGVAPEEAHVASTSEDKAEENMFSDSELASEKEDSAPATTDKKKLKTKKKKEAGTKDKKVKSKTKESRKEAKPVKEQEEEAPAPVSDVIVDEDEEMPNGEVPEAAELDQVEEKSKSIEIDGSNELPVDEAKPEKRVKKKKNADKKQKKVKAKLNFKEVEALDQVAETEEALTQNSIESEGSIQDVQSKSKLESSKKTLEQLQLADKKVNANVSEEKAVVTQSNNDEEEDIFEQSVMEICEEAETESPLPIQNPTQLKDIEVNEDMDTMSIEVTEASNDKPSALVREQRESQLNGTFVVETPKDNKKIQEAKLNNTYTPELFPQNASKADLNLTFETTPTKTNLANQTVTVSKGKTSKNDDLDEDEAHVLAPETPEKSDANTATNNGSGFVSTLVNFFSKPPKADETKVASVATGKEDTSESRSPEFVADKPMTIESEQSDMNSTYVLPSTKKAEKIIKPSLLNVTVCVKKDPSQQRDGDGPTGSQPVPILPPSKFYQKPSSSSMHDNPASRTFIKEPPSLDVVVEEDEGSAPVSSGKTGDKNKPGLTKQSSKDKDSKKGISSSSSSSSSSLKSGNSGSQPNLVSSSKKAGAATALGSAGKNPTFGSTGKLHNAFKSKPLEDAEKRRQELTQIKADNQKKKMDEWKKKTEKIKLEEEKKLKEKQKFLQPSINTVVLKKPTLPSNVAGSSVGFVKPKIQFGVGTAGKQFQNGATSFAPPLSKQPFHFKPPAPPSDDGDNMDDSFKTASSASASNSFLDQTVDGPLNSYDITTYEDLDEDLKHRENKTVPNWASDKESLKTALFSMVYLPEYEQSLQVSFPKPDRSYKLFPLPPRT